MPAKIQKIDNLLVHQILKSLDDRKAFDVVCIDLRDNEDAIIDYMIVCHGESTTQVNAVAGNVEKDVAETLNEKPHHIEGMRNAQWVILDYIDVVVHVFYHEMREFYKLEDLWSDSFSYKEAIKEKKETVVKEKKVTAVKEKKVAVVKEKKVAVAKVKKETI